MDKADRNIEKFIYQMVNSPALKLPSILPVVSALLQYPSELPTTLQLKGQCLAQLYLAVVKYFNYCPWICMYLTRWSQSLFLHKAITKTNLPEEFSPVSCPIFREFSELQKPC